MAIIIAFSSVPSLDPHLGSEILDTVTRKIAHIGEYSILIYLLVRALRQEKLNLSAQGILQVAFLVALAFAISDEYHQLFVLGREGTFRDVSIDAVGITLVPLWLTSALARNKK